MASRNKTINKFTSRKHLSARIVALKESYVVAEITRDEQIATMNFHLYRAPFNGNENLYAQCMIPKEQQASDMCMWVGENIDSVSPIVCELVANLIKAEGKGFYQIDKKPLSYVDGHIQPVDSESILGV